MSTVLHHAASFSRVGLEAAGFVGWRPFADLRAESPCPISGGVYVVTYDGPASFTGVSCGGWFRGEDPTVPAFALAANWVDGAEVVYIGKANNLRRRLREYAHFGAGKPVAHSGGRLIWQLSRPDDLRVAWLETPGRSPLVVEAEMIAAFRLAYGKPPFANYPNRMGR